MYVELFTLMRCRARSTQKPLPQLHTIRNFIGLQSAIGAQTIYMSELTCANLSALVLIRRVCDCINNELIFYY